MTPATRRAPGRLTLDPGNESRGDSVGGRVRPCPKLTLSFRDLFPESSSALAPNAKTSFALLPFAPLGRRCPEGADEGRSDGRASQRWSLIRGAAA